MENQTFKTIPLSELMEIEKWLYDYRKIKFPYVAEYGVSDKDAETWDSVNAKISDVQDAIYERITDLQRNTFEDVANL